MIPWTSTHILKITRLGHLLIERKWISQGQLEKALQIQRTSDQRLGDIMISHGWCNEEQIRSMAVKQRKLRMIAFFASSMMLPLQSMQAASEVLTEIPKSEYHKVAQDEAPGASHLLSDDSLETVVAQGLQNGNYDKLVGYINGDIPDDDAPETVVMSVFEAALPALNLLTPYEITDVELWNPGSPKTVLNPDGSLSVQLPKRIGKIEFKNLNFIGATTPALGNLTITDIRMTEDSSITLRARD